MEPLRLLFGLLFAMMSVGVLVLPVGWPFSKNDNTVIPSPASAAALESSLDTIKPIKLAGIPAAETVLSVRPVNISSQVLKDLMDQISLAKYLAAEKQYDEALDVLSKIPTANQDHYEVVYLRARILAWSGRHFAAEQKFHRLMAIHPDNTDLMVSYGYLQFYQGKMNEAEKSFTTVLKISPDYTDAKEGLIKTRKAM